MTKKKYVSCTRKFSNEIATKKRKRERERGKRAKFFFDHYLSDDKTFSSRERNPRDENFRFTFPRQIVVSLIPWQPPRSILVTWNSSLLATNKNEISPRNRSSVVIWSEHAPRENASPLKFSIVKCTPVTFVYRSHSIEIPVSLHWRPPRTILATPCVFSIQGVSCLNDREQ